MASLAKALSEGDSYLRNDTLVGHQSHVIAGDGDHVEAGLADAMFAQHAVEDFGGAAAPVLHLDAGLCSRRRLLQGVGGEGFHGGVKNDLAAFFLRRGDRTAPIDRRQVDSFVRTKQPIISAKICSHRKFLSHDKITARQGDLYGTGRGGVKVGKWFMFGF